MNQEAQKAITDGLLAGFGRGKPIPTGRAGFILDSTDFENGAVRYHDEWAAKTLGGGQELVQVGDKAYTRLYGGGNLDENELARLGITEGQVIGQLISFLNALGPRTRLLEDCPETLNGRWGYSYKVVQCEKEIALVVGREQITYDQGVVFIHWFLNSPIR